MKKVVKSIIFTFVGFATGALLSSFITQHLNASNSVEEYRKWVLCFFVFFMVWPCVKFLISSKEQKQKSLEKSDKKRFFSASFIWRYASTLYLLMSCFFNWSSSFASLTSTTLIDIFIKNAAAVLLLPFGILILLVISEILPTLFGKKQIS
ncbi:hypothetical protein [Enterococcus sp. DIV0187]|uniref:hypothetical protein n=1 Tax=Enterococcus sp. DIV0187 TaxID=2774644 RepID=UPI003F23F10B